jgi:hypothetical protein
MFVVIFVFKTWQLALQLCLSYEIVTVTVLKQHKFVGGVKQLDSLLYYHSDTTCALPWAIPFNIYTPLSTTSSEGS